MCGLRPYKSWRTTCPRRLSGAMAQRPGNSLRVSMACSIPLNHRAGPASDSSAGMARNKSLRSRAARFVSSTRYVIFRAQTVEDFAHRARSAPRDILQPLPDPLAGIRLGRDVEEPLIRYGILNDQLRLAVDGKDHGAARGLQTLDDIGRLPAKVRQRLNVPSDVHTSGIAPLKAPSAIPFRFTWPRGGIRPPRCATIAFVSS